MEWDDRTRADLETALNESDVVGVRLNPSGSYVDVLLHVLALPSSGPLMKDGRRILRLTAPAELRFLLRSHALGGQAAAEPAIPLDDLAAVEGFFDSLAWGGSMCGWRFFDARMTDDWPAAPSLVVTVSGRAARHPFYWFNECGAERDGESAAYCMEGTIGFDDILVLDASERQIPIETFLADGVRQWDAFYSHDERLSIQAQGAMATCSADLADAFSRRRQRLSP